MKFGVVVFPGSNCDHDAFYAISDVLHQPVEFIWHQSEDLANCDAVILPGGFAHGDYLRTGAIARFSPVMKPVEKFAKSGGLVLGICNGFQILLEAGLLPGAVMRNIGLRYICRHVHLRVETTSTPFTQAASARPNLENPHRPQRWKLHLRSADSRRVAEKSANCYFAIPRLTAATTPREIPTARWKISPASAIASAMLPA